jgi:hypothetical protein
LVVGGQAGSTVHRRSRVAGTSTSQRPSTTLLLAPSAASTPAEALLAIGAHIGVEVGSGVASNSPSPGPQRGGIRGNVVGPAPPVSPWARLVTMMRVAVFTGVIDYNRTCVRAVCEGVSEAHFLSPSPIVP